MSDTVAVWQVPLPDRVHRVEFEHGTTSGKRIVRVDGQEVIRTDWMFKLVGKESFKVASANCVITIDACSGFAYEYTLEVNGKPLQKFRENQSKIMKCWMFTLGSDGTSKFRVVLEKGTLDVWVNGEKVETFAEFTEDGTETHLAPIGNHSAFIKAVSSGKRRDGILHKLFIDGSEVPAVDEVQHKQQASFE